MKVVVTGSGAPSALEWTHRFMLTAGAATLGYCGLTLADAWLFQKRASLELDRAAPLAVGSVLARDLREGAMVGRLELARIGLSVMILSGSSPATLRRGVGHIPGTSMPGHGGNAAIAGHRDTFFRPLEKVLVDDVFIVTAPSRQYRYRVVSIEIVAPLDVWVLAPTAEESLTLVTCHPFDFIGSAPSRFVVRARRIADPNAKHPGQGGVPVNSQFHDLPRSSEVEVGQSAERSRLSVSARNRRAQRSRVAPRP